MTWFASLLPISLFIYFSTFAKGVMNGEIFNFFTSWVPSLGINLDFRLDNLALLFTLLITGIGSIVFLYTSQYLKGHPKLMRFYVFLSRSEEHTSELQSRPHLVCRLLLEK